MIPKVLIETYKLEQELSLLQQQYKSKEIKSNFDDSSGENSEKSEKIRVFPQYTEEVKKRYHSKINSRFLSEYKKCNNENLYFLGCSFHNYKKNYDSRWKQFKQKYCDAERYNFINEELTDVINFSLPDYINLDVRKSISFSLERTIEFLINKLKENGFEIRFSKNKEGIEILSEKDNLKYYFTTKTSQETTDWKAGNYCFGINRNGSY
ncbi:hypothetical protein [Apibacter sp. HY039]|uniref:hypothetical protein n=1 Tax=Apibacter sp. HY039 TaxID=2501476 RepID=UPI000FEBF0D6|nr:hypothetical protein [Apibacter sp. HY039]